MFAESAKTLTDAFRLYDCYNVVGHVRPDGDSLGSASAVCLILREMGIDAVLIENDLTPPEYTWMLESVAHVSASDMDHSRPLIVVDVSHMQRLGELVPLAYPAALICIDHHPQLANAKPCAKHNFIDPVAPSCTAVIARHALRENLPLGPEIVQRLLAGLLTDTRYLAVSAVTQECCLIMGELLCRGANLREIGRHSRDLHRPLWGLPITASAFSTLEIHGSVAFETVKGAAELAQVGRVVDCAEASMVGLFVINEETGSGRVSLRAKNPATKLNEIARLFGGGGHACASGIAPITIERMEEVKSAMLARAKSLGFPT